MGVPGRTMALLVVGSFCGSAAAGCAGAATRTSTTASTKPAASVASVVAAAPAAPSTELAAPAGATDPCRIAQNVTDAAIAKAQTFASSVMDRELAAGKYDKPKPDLPIEGFEVSSWLQCTKTQGGAWAFVLAKAALTPQSDYDWSDAWVLSGEVALAHVNGSGAVVLAPVSTQAGPGAGGIFMNPEQTPNCCEWVFGGLEPMELYDFDGDGEPEVHVGASYGHEGVSERSDALLTFKDGRIEPYAPAALYAFEAMRDVTGDGIPDLLMSEGLGGTEQCGSGFPGDGNAMTFIAHALPGGGFSNVDAEARAFAKATCPKRPASIKTLDDVQCARLWGVTRAKLELQVRAQFTPWDCDAELAGRPQKPSARGEFELMLSASGVRVPFTLP